MILYHGTALKKGKQILRDGFIRANIERNYKDYNEEIKNSTDGYVYLTTNFYTAYYYGNINLLEENAQENKYVYIFVLDIAEELLLPDYDEIEVKLKKIPSNNMTVEESVELCGCVRVNQDVYIDGMDYTILPGTFNMIEDEEDIYLCRELSKLQFEVEENKDIIDRAKQRFKAYLIRTELQGHK